MRIKNPLYVTAAPKNQTNNNDPNASDIILFGCSVLLPERFGKRIALFLAPSALMIEILQSPSTISFLPSFDGILNVSTVLFKNLHILYHGIFCFAICNVYKISDINIKNRVGVHKYDRQEGNLSVGNVILQRLFMHGTEPLPLYRPLPHRFCRRGWSYRALHTCSEERRVRPAPRAW